MQVERVGTRDFGACPGCEGAHAQVERVGSRDLERAQVVRVRMRRLRGWARGCSGWGVGVRRKMDAGARHL